MVTFQTSIQVVHQSELILYQVAHDTADHVYVGVLSFVTLSVELGPLSEPASRSSFAGAEVGTDTELFGKRATLASEKVFHAWS